MTVTTPSSETWPALPYEAWKDTLDTLHMWTQVVGKVKLELVPFLNEWWQVAFTVTARGLTTGDHPLRPPGLPGRLRLPRPPAGYPRQRWQLTLLAPETPLGCRLLPGVHGAPWRNSASRCGSPPIRSRWRTPFPLTRIRSMPRMIRSMSLAAGASCSRWIGSCRRIGRRLWARAARCSSGGARLISPRPASPAGRRRSGSGRPAGWRSVRTRSRPLPGSGRATASCTSRRSSPTPTPSLQDAGRR